MRLNRNFANVYTPFHEFDESSFQIDPELRKGKRAKRRQLRMDFNINVLGKMEENRTEELYQDMNSHGEYEVNQ